MFSREVITVPNPWREPSALHPPEKEPVPVLAFLTQKELLPFHTLPIKRSHQCQLSQEKEQVIICPSPEGSATVPYIPNKLVSLPNQKATDTLFPIKLPKPQFPKKEPLMPLPSTRSQHLCSPRKGATVLLTLPPLYTHKKLVLLSPLEGARSTPATLYRRSNCCSSPTRISCNLIHLTQQVLSLPQDISTTAAVKRSTSQNSVACYFMCISEIAARATVCDTHMLDMVPNGCPQP